MENKDELKETDIKNYMRYYFDDIIRFWDRDIEFRDVLLDENSYETYENILIHNISNKTSMDAKPLHIRFDKIDGFIKIHNKIRCLVLFYYSYCDKICDKSKYLKSEKKVVLQIVLIIILQK